MSVEQGRRPPIPPRSECRDCAFPILFVKVGKSLIPVNPFPDDTGNVCAVKAGNGLYGYVISRSKPWDPRYLRFMPHAATCEAIEQNKRPKPADDPALF